MSVWVAGLVASEVAFVKTIAKEGVKSYTIKGNASDIYLKMLDEKLKVAGYLVTDPHKNVQKSYKKKYAATTLDVLSFMSILNKKRVKPLLNLDPTLAGFNPFNLLIYKHKTKDETVISHLTAEAIIDILGITDINIITEYKKSFDSLEKMIADTFPKAVVTSKRYDSVSDDRMMHFELPFERPKKLGHFVDAIQEKFEEVFESKGYIMAGYFNFKESFDGTDTLPNFDAFWTYSLCHFEFSYTVFDNENARPEIGVLAPCTMYMYIEKGSNTLVIGMPKLSNWAKMFKITEKKRADFIKRLDIEIPEIMKSFGIKEVAANSYMREAK